MHDLGYRLQNGECGKTALIKFLAVLSFLCSSPLNKVNVATQGRKSLQLIRLHNNKEGFFFFIFVGVCFSPSYVKSTTLNQT